MANSSTVIMLAALFIFLLVIETVATPTPSRRLRTKQKKVKLPDCESEIFQKSDKAAMRNKTKLICVKEDHPKFVRQDMEFDCDDVQSLKSTTIDDTQYLIIANKTGVKVKKWNDDNRNFDDLQFLPAEGVNDDVHVYDVDVVHYKDETLLSVAILDLLGCGHCHNLSHLYRWNRTSQEFIHNPIQSLPTASNIHWFREHYHNQTTLIAVFGDCNCPIKVYYWNKTAGRLMRSDETHQPRLTEQLPTSDMLVQSVRYKKRQYLLFAFLGRDDEDKHTIQVFKWTNEKLASFGSLHIPVQERKGLSALEFRGETFICAITKERQLAIFLKLNFATASDPTIEQSCIGNQITIHQLSFCKLFEQSHDLYAAVGKWNGNTMLLRYNRITEKFVEVGELSQTLRTKDLVNFNSWDDIFLVTANVQGKCLFDKFD